MKTNISNLKNIKILYAEDELSLREITLNILKGFTKDQYVATNGLEGLELFKKHQEDIDLIITDVNMPEMNGLEMIKEIKKINPNIPIIVATAFSNTEYLLDAIDIGVDKYILKPLDVKKLLNLMSQSLLYHELKDLYHDTLTQLPNRNKLRKDLADSNNVIMALINIDKFSTMNDLYGESNGDKLLYEFSLLLREHFPDDMYELYRIEADKFAIVVKDNSLNISEFYKICKNYSEAIEKNPIKIEDTEIDINTTIGIAEGQGTEAYKYVQRVIDYARKKLEQIMIYDDSFNIQKSFEENIKWVKRVKKGLTQNRFVAYYQPIVDIKTKEIFKYEALIRYIDDNNEPISPYQFLDIARKAKLYPKIIKVMINEAFKLIRKKNKRVAVNISFDDISSTKTVNYVYNVLEENKDISDMLEFEILESEEIQDFDAVIEFISRVKNYNCVVGVDDFGAGYSNFNMLTSLDINFVKIDGSLINNIDNQRNQEIIVTTISNFSKQFGFKTVAEFVSSENIYNKVKELNIDYAQGYFFGKPIASEEV